MQRVIGVIRATNKPGGVGRLRILSDNGGDSKQSADVARDQHHLFVHVADFTSFPPPLRS